MRRPVRIDQSIPTHNVEGLERNVLEFLRAFGGGLGFGSPGDPTAPDSGVRPNGVAHNGATEHFACSWVEVTLSAGLPAAPVFAHNLDLPPVTATTPNVLWVPRVTHSGVGGGAVSLEYAGGAVTANSIALAAYGATRTVDGPNPLTLLLLFFPIAT